MWSFLLSFDPSINDNHPTIPPHFCCSLLGTFFIPKSLRLCENQSLFSTNPSPARDSFTIDIRKSYHAISFPHVIDVREFLCGFISLDLFMALILNSPTSCALTSPISWVGDIFVGRKGGSSLVFESLNFESSEISADESPREKAPRVTCQDDNKQEYIPGGGGEVDATDSYGEMAVNEKSGILMIDIVSHEEKITQELNIRTKVHPKKENSGVLLIDQGISDSLEMVDFGGAKEALKPRKRPSMLVVPAYSGDMEFGEMGRKLANKEFEVEGRNFSLASKKGRRTSVMEDGYGVMLDILGDPKQVGDHAFSLISDLDLISSSLIVSDQNF